jgi:serine/threonine protein kinase
MAPEVVRQTAHTLKADIWSIGCLVVEMLTGQQPWGQLNQMQVMFKVSPPPIQLFLSLPSYLRRPLTHSSIACRVA